MGVSFNIKISDKILKERGVNNFGAVQRRLDRDVLNYCEAFVPKDTGALIRSGDSGTVIGSGIICYTAPYARYQYYGVSSRGKRLNYRGGGLRGPYWFERMKVTYKYKLLKEAAILAGGKAQTKPQPKKQSSEEYINSLRLGKVIYTPITKQSQIDFFKKRSK